LTVYLDVLRDFEDMALADPVENNAIMARKRTVIVAKEAERAAVVARIVARAAECERRLPSPASRRLSACKRPPRRDARSKESSIAALRGGACVSGCSCDAHNLRRTDIIRRTAAPVSFAGFTGAAFRFAPHSRQNRLLSVTRPAQPPDWETNQARREWAASIFFGTVGALLMRLRHTPIKSPRADCESARRDSSCRVGAPRTGVAHHDAAALKLAGSGVIASRGAR
jgi:hypothetical protein